MDGVVSNHWHVLLGVIPIPFLSFGFSQSLLLIDYFHSVKTSINFGPDPLTEGREMFGRSTIVKLIRIDDNFLRMFVARRCLL